MGGCAVRHFSSRGCLLEEACKIAEGIFSLLKISPQRIKYSSVLEEHCSSFLAPLPIFFSRKYIQMSTIRIVLIKCASLKLVP